MNSLLQTAITAALQAGKAILDIYDDPASNFEIEHKADHSPLTIADRVSNEIILKQLKNTPYPVISEENKATAYAIQTMANGMDRRPLWTVQKNLSNGTASSLSI